jgi:hypothetical protein
VGAGGGPAGRCHTAEGRRGSVWLSTTWRGGGSLGGQQRRTSGGGGQRLRHGRDGALTSGLGATVPQFKSIQTGQIHFKRNSNCFE